ncbi:MAG: hypothetical protein QOG16_810, partial [Actinomycetota bacterium]|nr:hypothetical protein [Actinomycetota bacterium]
MTEAPRAPLIGREEESNTARSALERAATGRLEVFLIEGEAGIGKTRLVTEATQQGQRLGFGAWTASFEEMERVRSFGPLLDALDCHARSSDPRRRDIAGMLLPDVDPGARSDRPFQIVEALVGLMEEEALAQPRVLVLDNLHWADPMSLYSIRTAVRRLAYVPLLLIGTMRPQPRTRDLEHLLHALDHEGWQPTFLSPLGDDAVLTLAAHLLGSPPSSRLVARLSSASGNPFFIMELVDALKKDGQLDAAPEPASLSPDVRLTILTKISFLSEPSIELLRAAAVLGTNFFVTDLVTIVRLPLGELMPRIRECLAASVLDEDEEKIRFRHDLIREALYLDMPAAIRKGMHLEIARLLLDAGASPTRVAEHFLIGAEAGDRAAITVLRQAALEASRSPQTRIELLRAARELHLDDDPEVMLTDADLADALVGGAHFDEAIPLARSLLDRTQDAQLRRRLRRLIARALRIAGRWRELMDTTDEWLQGDLHPE